ncbi:ankyrin repeat protein, partial [Usnea florida]
MIAILQDLVGNGVNLNAQDEEGLTSMHWASREGHLTFVRFLCERGADMNLKSNDGQSALHEAIRTGHTSVANLLLKHEA